MTLQERLQENPDEFVTFKSYGDVLSVPKAILGSMSPKQLAWLNSTTFGDGKHAKIVDPCVALALEIYCRTAHGIPLLKPVAKVAPRQVSKFQFWLRCKLTSLGLI